jgi:hypothetical protein
VFSELLTVYTGSANISVGYVAGASVAKLGVYSSVDILTP